MQNFNTKVNAPDPGDNILTAEEFNNLVEELENLIASAGLAFNVASTTQIAEAISEYVQAGFGYITGGSADAITLSKANGGLQAVSALRTGQVIVFTPTANNTGTVTVNVEGTGAVGLKTADGVDLTAGTIVAGTQIVAAYNGSEFRAIAGIGASSVSSTTQYARYSLREPSGSSVQALASAFFTYPLNTEEQNDIVGASFNAGSSTITLPAGTYHIDSDFIMINTQGIKMKLVDVTGGGSTDLELSTSANSTAFNSADGVTVGPKIKGRFTFATQVDLQFEYYCQAVNASGLLFPVVGAGVDEISAIVEIEKLA